MNIDITDKPKFVKFDELRCGDIFMDADECVYIKTTSTEFNGEMVNAVSLRNGWVYNVESCECVLPLIGKLEVKPK